jgi:hypothetical protein
MSLRASDIVWREENNRKADVGVIFELLDDRPARAGQLPEDDGEQALELEKVEHLTKCPLGMAVHHKDAALKRIANRRQQWLLTAGFLHEMERPAQ